MWGKDPCDRGLGGDCHLAREDDWSFPEEVREPTRLGVFNQEHDRPEDLCPHVGSCFGDLQKYCVDSAEEASDQFQCNEEVAFTLKGSSKVS